MKIHLPRTRTPGASSGHYGSSQPPPRIWTPEVRHPRGPPPLPHSRFRNLRLRRKRRGRMKASFEWTLIPVLIMTVLCLWLIVRLTLSMIGHLLS